MARAEIFCEVTCGNCGSLSMGSTSYKNASTISRLKRLTKDWIWSNELAINLCPACQKELKENGVKI